MNTFVPIIISLVVLIAIFRVVYLFKDNIKFFSTGLDSGFKLTEIYLLWKLAKIADLEDPLTLYWSLPALEKGIAATISNAKNNGLEHSKKTQDFLAKLYAYRTKLELNPKNKKGLTSTKFIDVGQKIRVILKGRGVFSAEVLNNSKDLIISLPLQNNQITIAGVDWVGMMMSVYLWRKDDAAYVFDTYVRENSMFNGKSVLCLSHTDNLLRTQKRRSVRCECHIYAQMYIIKSETADLKSMETQPGLKCLLEDISEDGALIRIGGKGVSNLHIKLQFTIGESFIVMSGFVRGVEYDEEKNQSKLHFECTYIDTPMKNAILSYVYNVIPDEEKEIIQAMELAEKDEKNREDTKSDGSTTENNNAASSSTNGESVTISSQATVAENVNPADITNVTDPLNLPAIEEDF
ncbi:MAG: PilZ domain-containing protein [Treponemataceae bacterium]|nr:PilZ domain-containing protein [Treponemataceae bacterium]